VTAAVWHDIECGHYTADHALWRRFAAAAPGPVLDVGAGTGRVALDLAAAGHEVVALDADPSLLAELAERAAARGLAVETVAADARTFDLPGRAFGAILVPMQTIQLLGGPEGRGAFLARAAAHLAPGGRVAAALSDALVAFRGNDLVLPDVGEHDGVLLFSQPVAVRDEGEAWVIERLRSVVTPAGERSEEHDEVRLDIVDAVGLEAEGRRAGLVPERRDHVPETLEYVGSDVVVLARG
jgi:SAM-dependent methyltransferase